MIDIKKPEILAPAGSREALEAAVKAGADAVYVGSTLFSARAFAGNFDEDELKSALEYCHFYDVRLYLALNTLLKPDETYRVGDLVRPFYQFGLDGVIVQDAGVVKILREAFPDLPLHASTQMSISSSFGAKFLKNQGFTRVVPARELSLSEIESIKKNVDIEIETFVHGAMCYCYSGRCLLSSFIGGRSGNRGRCAQPCRQCYQVKGGKREYIMSLKDMCLIESVPELCNAGIDSFKIEGRMKKPEYVAAAAHCYREAVDMYCSGAWDLGKISRLEDDLRDIYNRGGFSKGYYFMQEGKAMLANKRPNHSGLLVGKVERVAPPKVYVRISKTVNPQDVLEIRGIENVELTSSQKAEQGTLLSLNGKEFRKIKTGNEVYRTRNNLLIDKIQSEIINPEKVVLADAQVTGKLGQPLQVKIFDGDVCAASSGNVVNAASNRPADSASLEEKLRKTGGSGVKIRQVNIDIDPDSFIPMSELNALRRQALERFKVEKTLLWHKN